MPEATLRFLGKNTVTFSMKNKGRPIVAVTTTDKGGAMRSRPLTLRRDLFHHAADFDWGQDGPGATQLADHLEDGELAVELHERFQLMLTALLLRRAWALGDDTITKAVQRLRE